ncbi:MAG TPA: TonB-dependent receptor, partial [Bryobacteraceae bacterium]
INPAAAQIVSMLPAANLPGTSNNLIGSVPLRDDNHRMDGRIDERFSEKTTGFIRYGFTEGSLDQGSLLGALGNPVSSEFRAMNGVASISVVALPSLVGEFRVGYDRYRNQLSPWGDFSSLSSLAGLGFANGLPSINIAGYTSLGFAPNVPSKQVDNVYDGATNWISHFGINKVSFGVSARALEVNGIGNPFFSSNGSFVFGPGSTLNSTASGATLSSAALQANAFASFLTGTPSESGISNYTLNPGYRQKQYAAYLTDTVNIFQRLWVELGVRYDIFSPLQPANTGGAIIFDPFSNTSTTTGSNQLSNNIYRYDLNNVAPRVGLAFRPVDRLVFRAGYGIHYFALPFAMMPFNPLTQSVQNGMTGGLGYTPFTTPTVPASTGTNVAANTPYLYGPRDFNTPYVQTFSAMIQGDLGNGFLLDVGYVGNVGRQLPYEAALTGQPGSGLSGLAFATRTANSYEIAPGLNSNYNSLQVNITKKFGAGLALTAAYAYSKALDDGFNLLDPYDRSNNYGPADWDRTHILSVTHVWQLPFGPGRGHLTSGWAARAFGDWQLNGIFHWSTGSPFTVTADPLACACLGATAVPAMYTGSSFGSGVSGSSFNPNLFSTPMAGTFGTLSRNAFRGPDLQSYNAALFRNFTVNENIKLELRGEVYNLTNSANLQNPVSNIMSPGFGSSVGNINGMAGRQFQVAARILF